MRQGQVWKKRAARPVDGFWNQTKNWLEPRSTTGREPGGSARQGRNSGTGRKKD